MTDIVLKVIADMSKASPELKKFFEEMKKGEGQVKTTKTQFSKFEEKFKSAAKEFAKGAAVIVGAGLAIKKVFDFAEAGAGITRLRDSGDQLAKSLGGNMREIVMRVQAASLGTVSELDVITSSNRAMMLGLGADADQLANLMEVAAFRGRAMGLSTTQAFNDIVTGVGRMSPLILDNLGIVIDATTRYREWSAETGISVSQLDAAQKKTILFNAVLEDGNRQLEAAGGLVADNATEYELLRTSITNSLNAGKEWLSGFVTPAIAAGRILLTGTQEINKAIKEQSDRTAIGAETYEDYVEEMERVGRESGRFVGTLEELEQKLGPVENGAIDASGAIVILTEKQIDARKASEEGAEASEQVAAAYAQMAINAESTVDPLQAVTDRYEEQALALGILPKRMRDVTNEFGSMEGAADDFFGSIDTGLSTTISGFLDKLAFEMAGGGKLTEITTMIADALGAGLISEQQATEMFSNVFVQAEALQVRLGEISATEAARNIQEEFGTANITFSESLKLVTDTLAGINNIDGKDVEAQITIFVDTVGNLPVQFGGGLGGGGATGRSEGFAKGGRLPTSGVNLVGEEGPELVINGVVVPTGLTKALMSLGVNPEQAFVFGGPLLGGGTTTTTTEPPLPFLTSGTSPSFVRPSRRRTTTTTPTATAQESAEMISSIETVIVGVVESVEQAITNLSGNVGAQVQQVADQIASTTVSAIESSNQQVTVALSKNTDAILSRATDQGVGDAVGQEMEKLI